MSPKGKEIEVFTEREIVERIHTIRGQQVMLDRDLAEMYGVLTKNLNKAVARNAKRFPDDFMFRLDLNEYSSLRFQFGTLKQGQHSKYLPCVFTANGVAMLSSVLNSERAIQVNIQIMRIITKSEQIKVQAANIQKQLQILTHQSAGHKLRIDVAFDAIRFLLDEKINK
jgi:hypothetical protein